MATTSEDRKVLMARKVTSEIIGLCRMEDVSLSRSTLEATIALVLSDELSHSTLRRLVTRMSDTRESVHQRLGVPR